jgi:hypothetical protein
MKRPSNFLIKTLLLCIIILVLGVLKSNAQTYFVTTTATVTDPWAHSNICTANTAYTGPAGNLPEGIRQLNRGSVNQIIFTIPGTFDLSGINNNQTIGSINLCANNATIEPAAGVTGVIITSTIGYTDAIKITGNNNTIRNIEFRFQVGIDGGDGNTITGCTFNPTNTSRDGVYIYNGATLNTVINNTFTGNTGSTAASAN